MPKKTSSHIFTDGPTGVVKGKPQFENVLSVAVTRYKAYRVVEQILAQLEHGDNNVENQKEVIVLNFAGKLTEEEE